MHNSARSVLGHGCLFGVFGIREKEGHAFVDIAVSEEGTELPRKWMRLATERAIIVKTMIEAAREFIEENDLHITTYEDLMKGWEKEISEFICTTKCRLLPVDAERGEEMREVYSQGDEERLELVEALPHYELIAIDDAFCDETPSWLQGGWKETVYFIRERRTPI